MATDLVPFVFVAKHDTSAHVRELFQQVWDNSVGGTRAILLYFQEILEISTSYLTSATWAIKHSTALTIADVAKTQGLTRQQQDKLWPALRNALNGKTWEGKELVLEAFGDFAKQFLESRENEAIISEQMKEVWFLNLKHMGSHISDHVMLDHTAGEQKKKCRISTTCTACFRTFCGGLSAGYVARCLQDRGERHRGHIR